MLLEVQTLDSELDRVAHRLRTLPQIAEVDRLDGEGARLRQEIVVLETELGDLQRALRKAEADVEQVRSRAVRDRERLDSGQITSAKELESLQSELASLARRQSELEDAELEVMESVESTEARLADLRAQEVAVAADSADARRGLAEARTALETDAERLRGERGALAGGVPADLLTLYDKLREQFGGVGAAALLQRRCEGCRIELSSTDLTRLRDAAADEVLRCEECRRILVRTDKSGL